MFIWVLFLLCISCGGVGIIVAMGRVANDVSRESKNYRSLERRRGGIKGMWAECASPENVKWMSRWW